MSPSYALRYSLYNVPALPTCQFGGNLQDVGGGSNIYTRYLSKYNQVVGRNSPIEISQSTVTIGENLVINANVTLTNNVTTSNNKILFIITRYQDSDYFSSVVSYDDYSFNLSSTGESQTYEHSVPIDPSWNLDDLKTVVIVQSWGNTEILQGSIAEISTENMFTMNAQFTDILSDDDQDGVINPGEDVTLQLMVENSSLNIEADDVTGELACDNPYLTLEQTSLSFGAIQNGDAVSQDLVIHLQDDIPLGDVIIDFTVSTSYTDMYGNPGEFSYTYPLVISVNLFQTGWPLDTEFQIDSSPAVVDINQDGIKEAIYGEYGGLLHVVDPQGNSLSGFPFNLGDDIWGSPAVADLEGDGDLEIIIGSKNKHLLILNADGSVQADYDALQYIMGTPAVGNIDDDADLEVVFGGYSSPGKLFAINPDGTPVTGFPYELGQKIQRGVALADFNGNGKDDIVCGTDSEAIVVVMDDLTIADGFPFQADNDFRCAPSVLDISGEKIIFCGSRDDKLYAVNADGSLRFSIQTGGDVASSPGFVSYNDAMAIFFGSDDGYLYGVDINGIALSGWPVFLEDDVESSPVFADLDSDGTPEVVAGTIAGDFYAIHMDGTMLNYFPVTNLLTIKGSPTIEDLDQDGDLEIFSGTIGDIFAIDVKTPGNNENMWSMHRGNLKRSGVMTGSGGGSEITLNIDYYAGWNLVGLPLTVSDSYYQNLFPNAVTGTLYGFDESYYSEENLYEGEGYVLRLSSTETVSITGFPISSLDLQLQEGWNLITGISTPVHYDDIIDPSNIIIDGTLFGFFEGYIADTTVHPGKGYWIRASADGIIQLQSSD